MIPKISIIVPAFNVENKIARCLNSLINQTIRPIEIIIVNDGSTDNTLKICEQYAAEHPEIIVLDQVNAGVSHARNNAINRATGEYIGFCDADDYVDPEMYQDLVDVAEKRVDVVCCGYQREFLHLSRVYFPSYPFGVVLDKKDIENSILTDIFYDRTEKFEGIFSICNKIYRKKMIIENNIWFPAEWDHAEDANFNVQALLQANSIIFVKKAYYHYVKEIRKKTLTSRYSPDFFMKELRFRKFIEQSIGTELNLNYENVNGWLLLIEKAETNAITLCRKEHDTVVREQWLRTIFNNKEYRHCMRLCSDSELSSNQQKEKKCIERNDYFKWLEVIRAEMKTTQKYYYRKKFSRIFSTLLHK